MDETMSGAAANDACAGCGLNRRQFVGRGALAAAAALLAACGGVGGDAGPTLPSSGQTVTVKIADYPSLASVGGIAAFNTSAGPIAVVRTDASSFIALSRTCPHQGTTVNVSGSGFLCPNHGARFDSHGNWVGGQRTSNMYSLLASYDASTGVLTITT
jgi:cytochrome b6-f complex iron-sulfur subunit